MGLLGDYDLLLGWSSLVLSELYTRCIGGLEMVMTDLEKLRAAEQAIENYRKKKKKEKAKKKVEE